MFRLIRGFNWNIILIFADFLAKISYEKYKNRRSGIATSFDSKKACTTHSL